MLRARASAIAHLLNLPTDTVLDLVDELVRRGFSPTAALDKLVLDWPI
jgi:hypothetical protein